MAWTNNLKNKSQSKSTITSVLKYNCRKTVYPEGLAGGRGQRGPEALKRHQWEEFNHREVGVSINNL